MYSRLCGYWLSFLIIKQSPLYNTVTPYKSYWWRKRGRERTTHKRKSMFANFTLFFFLLMNDDSQNDGEFSSMANSVCCSRFFHSFTVNNYLRTMGSHLFAWDWVFSPSLSVSRCECAHFSPSLITLYFCFCANLHTKFGHKPFIVCVWSYRLKMWL